MQRFSQTIQIRWAGEAGLTTHKLEEMMIGPILFRDGTLAAIINVDGAWIDLVKRKLAVPDEFIRHIFETFPQAKDFQLIVPEKKS